MAYFMTLKSVFCGFVLIKIATFDWPETFNLETNFNRILDKAAEQYYTIDKFRLDNLLTR